MATLSSRFSPRNLRVAAPIAAVLILIGCSDSTAVPVPGKFIVTTDQTSPVAGEVIDIKAQLADADGNPIRQSGRAVSWVSDHNLGRLEPASSVTDADGSAATRFTTGIVAGVTHRVVAVDYRYSIQGITPEITTVAGPPATYLVAPRVANPEVGSTIVISAQIADRNRNPTKVGGRIVAWTDATDAGPTGASFSSSTSTTNADGIATVNFTIGSKAAVLYKISVVDDQGTPGISGEFAPRSGPMAMYLVYPSVNDPPAGTDVVVVAQAADAHGNPAPVQGLQIQWSMTGAGGSLNRTSGSTDAGGITVVILSTARTAGATYTVSASDASGRGGTTPSITTTPQVTLASLSTGLGAGSSCGIDTNGKAWCWGANEAGELGNSNALDRNVPGKVSGNSTMTSLSAGVDHTCGIAGGVVLCWGNNATGQLGDNTLTSRSVPTPIGSSATFTSVSVGAEHTCAVATGGDVYCWGFSGGGRLGTGSQTTNGLSPVKVSGNLSFVAVSAGVDHTCGITTAGDAYCWGSNEMGKLGDGTVLGSSIPRLVTGGRQFTSISVGNSHTCGLSGGNAYCWGDDAHGQLGTGAPLAPRNVPTQVGGGLTFVAISSGGFHTCAIAADGKAYCWGDNTTGELGDVNLSNSTYYYALPNAVSGGLTFKSIAVGGGMIGNADYYYYYADPGGHSCGVTTAGVAYCWGSNNHGELGIGPSTAPSRGPVKVLGQP